jgi:inositol oxygenase
MGVWEAMETLNTLVDESDPDVSDNIDPTVSFRHRDARTTDQRLPNRPPFTDSGGYSSGWQTRLDAGSLVYHTIATRMLTKREVTGLVHDLGKLLYLFGSQGQWDVVGVCLAPSVCVGRSHLPKGHVRRRM